MLEMVGLAGLLGVNVDLNRIIPRQRIPVHIPVPVPVDNHCCRPPAVVEETHHHHNLAHILEHHHHHRQDTIEPHIQNYGGIHFGGSFSATNGNSQTVPYGLPRLRPGSEAEYLPVRNGRPLDHRYW
ncbi:hypothetical protein HDE_13992 [Halotydeus destructor]|nr:hypothetical protein HDE_13992 [Halotydeus destructor]